MVHSSAKLGVLLGIGPAFLLINYTLYFLRVLALRFSIGIAPSPIG